MSETFDQSDRALLAELRAVLDEVDPMPVEVMTAAQGSFTWRTIDAELAELVDDSALATPQGIRSHGGPRLMIFEATDVTIVAEVSSLPGGHRRILGQIVHPRRARVEVRHPDGMINVDADELGRFTVETVPAGPVSMACQFGDAYGDHVVTSWVVV